MYHNRMYNIKVTKREHSWNDDCQGRIKVLGEKSICMSLLPSKKVTSSVYNCTVKY